MTAAPSGQDLAALKGRTVPVQEILDLFQVRVRDHRTVHRISQILTDAGLTTLPHFAICGPRTTVDVVPLASVPAQPSPADTEEDEADEALPSAALPQRLLLGDIPSARRGLLSVGPATPLAQTTFLMRTKGLSQVPVTSGMAQIHGVVTWGSVAKMYEAGKTPTLDNAMEKDSFPLADARQEFFAALPVIREHGYLLVRGDDGCLSGIVTAADVTERFEGAARPFFIVGEIESLLRRCLGAALDEESIRAVQTNKRAEQRTGQVSDLMFGDYLKLLDGDQNKTSLAERADANWEALKWPNMPREQFVSRLKRVKDIRNRIAHFDEKPLPQEMLDELTTFAKLLRAFVS
ncbi:CBS domain-containing protein [Streptomyces alkaliterrae]|uniref:CBS domain-containing protein n=1 Tax=Streptomyces alkaliterrae TaxID=2213162 RepID=A0A5P0YLR2_9ACTN|nr:CBS domain-containing protein [Streptomyces alkaliterrae]MBB1257853.1 CBS domain-containing protein [Streptomyces alkaliterrae]MQS01304.1 CBS domain-containing protein [Streptomyces alkaliterrae]